MSESISQSEFDRRFGISQPGDEDPDGLRLVSINAQRMAEDLVNDCPPCRELNLALTKLEECTLWATAAIYRGVPREN